MSLDHEDEVPVLFEIDDDTGEATGTVHPFCSESCRLDRVGETTVLALPHGIGIVVGTSTDVDRQAICENCGHPIFRVG